MRRAREGRETKRVSFSLRNCMFATLHVALTTARKDCRSLSHRCTRPYVHPRQTLNSSTARSGSRGSGAPLGRRSAALTRDSRPVHCALRAGSLGRIYPRAALDEHLLLEPAVCSARTGGVFCSTGRLIASPPSSIPAGAALTSGRCASQAGHGTGVPRQGGVPSWPHLIGEAIIGPQWTSVEGVSQGGGVRSRPHQHSQAASHQRCVGPRH